MSAFILKERIVTGSVSIKIRAPPRSVSDSFLVSRDSGRIHLMFQRTQGPFPIPMVTGDHYGMQNGSGKATHGAVLTSSVKMASLPLSNMSSSSSLVVVLPAEERTQGEERGERERGTNGGGTTTRSTGTVSRQARNGVLLGNHRTRWSCEGPDLEPARGSSQ